jgi:ATP-dependent DNA helicase RecG
VWTVKRWLKLEDMVNKSSIERFKEAVEMIKENSTITLKELAEETGLSIKGVEWNVKKLKTENMLKQIGPAKGGYWEVIEDENGS